jgi:hypothetical protein
VNKFVIDKARGERIKYVRLSVLDKLSQEAFADWVGGVTRGAVGNWELGKPVGLKNLTAIADKAAIDFDWLAFGRGIAPGPRAPSDQPRRSNREIRESIMTMYRQLPASEQREVAADLVRGIDVPESSSQAPRAVPETSGSKR